MLIDRWIATTKQQKTPIARLLVKAAKVAMRAEIPAPRAVFGPLYVAHHTASQVYSESAQRLYYQPMFRARCESVGRGLVLHCGIPYLHGDLRIRIGDNCKINGHSAFAAGSLLDGPCLTLGDETNIGYGVVISVSKSVTLGSHVRIADGCYVSDNPGHPLDAKARREHAPVSLDQIKPVVIEDDVWLGTRVVVMPGVRIGRGSVVGTGAIVTRDLPPFSLAVGNPARVIRQLSPNATTEAPAALLAVAAE